MTPIFKPPIKRIMLKEKNSYEYDNIKTLIILVLLCRIFLFMTLSFCPNARGINYFSLITKDRCSVIDYEAKV